MATDLDLAGRIILEDAFSKPLADLARRSRESEDALGGLGAGADKSVKLASDRVAELVAQIDALRAKSASGQLTSEDLGTFKQASNELKTTQRSLDELAGTAMTTGQKVAAVGEVGEAGLAKLTGSSANASRAVANIGNSGGKVRELQRDLAGLTPVEQAAESAMGSLGIRIAQFAGPAGIGLAVAGAAKLAISLAEMGMESGQAESRFVAFSGSTAQAAQNYEAMAAATDRALTRDEKMAAVSRIMGLELAKSAAEAAQVAEVSMYLGESTASAEQRIEAFTQVLASNSNRGLLKYGISAAQVRDKIEELKVASGGLSDETARQQAIMALAVGKMEQIKAAGGRATTTMVELKNAFEDYKDATGDVVAPIIEPIVKDASNILREAVDLPKAKQEFKDAIDSLTAVGDKEVAKAFGTLANGIFAQYTTELKKTFTMGKEGPQAEEAAVKSYLAAMADLTSKVKQYQQTTVEAMGGDEAFRIGLERSKAAFKAAYPDGYDPLKAFNDSLDDTRTKLLGITALQQQMGGVVGQLEALGKGMLAMPEMPKALGQFDASAWSQWATSLAQVTPGLNDVRDQVLATVKATEQSQASLLAAAQATGDMHAGLLLLAQGAGVTDGSIMTLIDGIDKLPVSWQTAIGEMGGFTAAYDQAIDRAVSKSNSLATAWAELINAGTAFRTMAEGGMQLQMPEMPKSLNYDTGPMRRYLDDLAAADPKAGALVQRTREQVAAFESAQQAILAHASSISVEADRLDYLSRAFLGPTAGVQDLVSAFESLPAAVQAALDPVALFAEVMARVQADASKPVTVDVKLKNMQEMLDQVEGMAAGLSGILSPDKINVWRDRARQAVQNMYSGMGSVTSWGLKSVDAQLVDALNKQIGDYRNAYTVIENDTKSHFDKIKTSASDAASQIEAALRRGLQVTDVQMNQSKGGLYKDVALESAKQLDDIAQHGREALSRHKDWIAKFQIPGPLLAPNQDAEAQLKAWAGDLRDSVTNLERPDLIDWGAFAESFKQQIGDGIGKDATLKRALSELKARIGIDLQGMSEDEVKAKIAKMLGMESPGISFQAMFETEADAKLKIAQQVLGSDPAITLPYVLVPLPGGAGFMQVPVGQDKAKPQQMPVQQVPVNLASTVTYNQPDYKELLAAQQAALQKAPPVTDAGSQAAAAILAGLDAAAKAQKPSAVMAGYWMADFAANASLFQSIGSNAGKVIGGALVQALTDSVGDARGAIARMIAPEVADILARKQPARVLDGRCQ